MTAAELLTKVKAALNITGTYQDATLTLYIDEVKAFLTSAGVPASKLSEDAAVGVIARGVADLWNYGNGDTKFSEYFFMRAEQLRREVIANE